VKFYSINLRYETLFLQLISQHIVANLHLAVFNLKKSVDREITL